MRDIKVKVRRGKRAKLVRNMLGLTRAEMETKCKISASTVQSWEDGKAGGLTVKGAERLVTAARKRGVHTTVDFLFYGNDHRPVFSEVQTKLAEGTAAINTLKVIIDTAFSSELEQCVLEKEQHNCNMIRREII